MVGNSTRSPKDPLRINLNDGDEVDYWTEEFGCSATELGRAVKAAGPLADRVRHYLERQKPPANDPTV